MMKSKAVYANKTIVLMGLSRAVIALAQLLLDNGAKVRISELNTRDHFPELTKELQALSSDVEIEFGKNSAAFFEGADFVVVGPGIRMDTSPLDEVVQRGTPILGEVELLARDIEVPVVAFAGTAGKTTAALLTAALFEAGGKKVFFSGDHGEPLAHYFQGDNKYDVVLLELSTAQLENLRNFRPHIAVLTALQPPFSEKYSSLEDSASLMRGVIRGLDEKCFIVYNFRDANLKTLVTGNPAPKRVYRRKNPIALGPEIMKLYKGCYLNSSRELVWTDATQKETYDLRDFVMPGLHNRDNLMAAINVVKSMGLASTAIQKGINTFKGVPHRLEFVKKRGGVKIINDSRCTSADNLKKSLESFPLEPVILIAGGRDAQADFSQIADLVGSRVKTLILVGEAKEHINRCLGDYSETFLVGTFEEAVLMSYQKSREGDIILLSPGCESYDMFVSYEERGNYFKKYVEEI